MPYTQVFTKILRVENLNIWRDAETGEIKVNLNVTLANDTESLTDGHTKNCDLTPIQETTVIEFVKAKVQELGIELDVDIPDWAE